MKIYVILYYTTQVLYMNKIKYIKEHYIFFMVISA